MKRSITSVLFLASLVLIGQVNSIAFDVFKQYSECKNLVMIEYIDSWQHYYYPDPTVENNNLDDSYYQSLGLADLSVNDALDAIQQIYQEMANDASVFECVNNRQYNWYATVNNQSAMYAAFFTDENLPDVKQIISSLDSALADNRRPNDQLQYYWGFGSGLNLPTLTNFSYVGDYSSLRNNLYNSFYDCYSFNFSTWLACSYYAKVDLDNREVRIERTSDYLEKMLLCQIMPLNQCIQEKKLFYGLTSWAEGFSDLDLSGQSLLNYFETAVKTSKNLENLESYDTTYISVWDQTAYYKAYKTSWSQVDLSSLGSSISLFSSDSLNIVAEIDSGSDRQTSFKNLNISTNKGVELNIDDCSIKHLQNITLTNSNGENEIQIIFYDYSQYKYYYIEAYHFDSRTTFSFAKSYFSISGPNCFFDHASGFLIDGPPQNANKKIENKMECKTMCKNAAKSMEKVRSVHNLALEKNTARCMNSC